jgi:TonB family protein
MSSKAITSGYAATATFLLCLASPIMAQGVADPAVPGMQKCTGGFQPPVPRGNRSSWVTSEDYPASALRAEEEGTVAVAITVGVDGRAIDVEITQSALSDKINQATIQLIMRRARFLPALNKCKPVQGEFVTKINWMIPD